MIGHPADVFIRNWGFVALRGVVAVVFGVLTILRPGLTLAVLILLFGGYAIANGLFTIITAVANRHGESHWGSLVVSGVLSIAFGVAAFVMPDVTAVLLLYIIAGWAILTGITEIITAIRLRKVITGEWLLVIAGALSIAFGLFLVMFPGAGALAVTLWIGVYAVMVGILLIALALRLRSWGRAHGIGGAARAA